ncbi:hypothetical protein NDU88_004041 [Pleurodeles waltl]|uniref:Uncharacterized protein n=1 Tax=Pleurodeles waltl TaxID=8319 RepID=A0AAV7VI42_PLEWA|nr:hypothetical protein NDU88_004041 [Pleurodeles waltl]
MGRAMRLPAVPANALVNITDDMVLDYCKCLAEVVVLITTTTVKYTGIQNWIHACHTRKVECPLDHEEEELLRVPTTAKQVSWLEREQRVSETGSKPIEDGSVTPVRDGEDLQEGDREPISIEAAGESRQWRSFPETGDLERQAEQLPIPEGKGVEVDQRHCDLTPSVPVAGPSRENTAEQEEVSSLTLKRTLTKGPLKGDKCPESQGK